jgi:hypothetical protein
LGRDAATLTFIQISLRGVIVFLAALVMIIWRFRHNVLFCTLAAASGLAG